MGNTGRLGVLSAAGVLAVALLSPFSAGAQDATRLSAQEIIGRMSKAYSGCASYRDTGVVRIEYLGTVVEHTEERPFATAFERPDCFRFEFEETNPLGQASRYVVWRLGDRVKTWWDIRPGVQEAPSLHMALAGATGVSGGSAHTIPALLLPQEISGRRLTGMSDIEQVADAEVGGASCFCIEGTYANMRATVCVGKRDFLVRRVSFERTFPNFRTRYTTTYEPVIDEPVAPELLEFRPPTPK